jgi:F0F1-type ATP synthase assembly protein I
MDHPPQRSSGEEEEPGTGDAPRPRDRRLGRAYQGAVESVIAVAVGAGIGAWADSRLGTSPFLLVMGVLIGFGSFVLRLVRLMRGLTPPADGR